MQHKLTNDPKIMPNKSTNSKITGPILALMLKQWTLPLSNNLILALCKSKLLFK